MANTYTLIASSTVTASGGAASIIFSSIPSTYTDLLLKYSGRETGTGQIRAARVRPNGATTSITGKRIYGVGTGVGVDSPTAWIMLGDGSQATASIFGNSELYLPNYNSSNNKSVSIDAVQEDNSASNELELIAGLWSNTAAITSLEMYPESGNFAQYTTAYLYGIKNS